jgi:hypothetical protein
MENLKNNKLLWLIAGITFLNLLVFGLGKFIVEKTADCVIEKLKNDYSPSPYGPGFDPDKINLDSLKKNVSVAKLNLSDLAQENGHTHGGISHLATATEIWRNSWEKERGFSPLQ